jgi:hypothetical protein
MYIYFFVYSMSVNYPVLHNFYSRIFESRKLREKVCSWLRWPLVPVIFILNYFCKRVIYKNHSFANPLLVLSHFSEFAYKKLSMLLIYCQCWHCHCLSTKKKCIHWLPCHCLCNPFSTLGVADGVREVKFHV